MKKIVFTLILSIFPLISFAQNSDSLRIGKTSRAFFIKDGQTYKASEYKKVFTNTEALHYMKKPVPIVLFLRFSEELVAVLWDSD
jgi:hypothetical protein